MVGVIMIGQLGETPLAAVGLANQIFFLLQLVLFGINSGAAMFTAQLWGKQDVLNIRRVISLGLMMGMTAGVIFLSIALLGPELAMRIYSKDPEVIALGSEYLRIFGWAFLFVPITFLFSMVLRSIGEVKLPMLVSTIALVFNMLASYALIFGKFGLPALEVSGAAIAGLTARILECVILLGIIYLRRLPIALKANDFLTLNLSFAGNVFRPILPVILNETFWSLGATAYNVVYARISTEAIAAVNIVATIDNMAFVLVWGISHATAIMVGNRIGAGEEDRALLYAKRSIVLGILIGMLIGGMVFLLSDNILGLYQVDPVVIYYASRMLAILGLFVWVRGVNSIIIIGTLRSGGDTLFSFFLDGVVIWVVGVPTAFFTAFVLDLQVYWVYLAIMSEEIVKFIIGLWRVYSRKWIHNLTRTV